MGRRRIGDLWLLGIRVHLSHFGWWGCGRLGRLRALVVWRSLSPVGLRGCARGRPVLLWRSWACGRGRVWGASALLEGGAATSPCLKPRARRVGGGPFRAGCVPCGRVGALLGRASRRRGFAASGSVPAWSRRGRVCFWVVVGRCGVRLRGLGGLGGRWCGFGDCFLGVVGGAPCGARCRASLWPTLSEPKRFKQTQINTAVVKSQSIIIAIMFHPDSL